MSVQGARAAAYEVLRAVSGDEAYANLLLPHAIARQGLDAKDAGLATELTYGTLRRRGTYDAIIAIAADRTVDRIDPAVLDALRLGVHQLLSTRVASHAAVNESVELARRNGGGRGAAGSPTPCCVACRATTRGTGWSASPRGRAATTSASA